MQRRTGWALAAGAAALMILTSPGVAAATPPGTGAVTSPTRSASTGPAATGPNRTADAAPEETRVEEVPLVVAPVVDGRAAPAQLDAAGEDVLLAADVEPHADRVVTDAVPVDGYQTVGVTWPDGADVTDLRPQLRVEEAGEWSPWRDVPVEDTAPDTGTSDATAEQTRAGSESIWVGDAADAVQLSFAATPDGGPEDMSLVLVGSPLVDPPSAAVKPSGAGALVKGTAAAPLAAAAPAPTVVSRAAWGARAQVCTPDVASRLVGAVLHHTAGSNSYATQAQAMQQIRNDQAYHIDGRGWCDIGYNFVVDKWGTIYEGRANSSTQPVIGVHAGGFNTGTVGISMLGSYGSLYPSSATQEAVAQIVAWRLGQYHRDPGGTFTYRTAGGENSKYGAGTDVTLPVLFSHRDVAYTACPGEAGYQTLGGMRARARELVSTTFVNPTVIPESLDSGGSFNLRAATLGNIYWRLEVTHAVSGAAIASSTGYAQQAFGGVVASWDARDSAGVRVQPGAYRLTLTGTDAANGRAVLPYTTTVAVPFDPNPPVVAPVPLGSDLRYVPVTPQRLIDTRDAGITVAPGSRFDLVVAGVAGVPADAKGVVLNVTAVNATAVTYVSVWPAGSPRPTTSALNTDPARSATAAGIAVGVGGEGKVSLYNNAGRTHLVVDVAGYFTASGGQGFEPLTTAARVLDTRTAGGAMSGGQTRTVTIAGQSSVPADATAVMVNVTSVGPGGNGYVAVVPSGTKPTTSTVNHLPGQDVANRAVVPLAGGKVDVLLAGASAHVVLDVVGWFGPSGGERFTPVTPVRAFDTRSGAALGAGESRVLPVVASTGVPADASAALLTLTAVSQSAPVTYLTAWPAGASRPPTSDLNTGRGRDQANSGVVRLGTGGAVQVYNNAGTTHVVGDVYGYFR